MSDFDDPTVFDDGPTYDDGVATEPDVYSDDGGDAAWSPVMSTPPPDLDSPPDLDPVDDLPPHELAGDDTPPPPPGGGYAEVGEAPPLPPAGELPPDLPPELADPVDLSEGGVLLDGAPMPPVVGDVEVAAPPAPSEVELGEGPPLAPEAPGPDQGAQSPVPPMGTAPGDLDDPGTPGTEIDLGAGGPLTPEQAGADVAPGEPTQSPFLPMGGDPDTSPGTEVDLGDGGPPMPPGLGDADTTTPPPTSISDPGAVELPGRPDEVVEPLQEDEIVLSVDPGDERVAAAAVTGAVLDQMDLDDPARERMIDLLERAAEDGTITVDEVASALLESGYDRTAVEGTEAQLTEVLATPDAAPRTAIANIAGEGPTVCIVRANDDLIELESVRTGAVYAAEPREVARAWRDSGATVLSAPPAPVPPAPVEIPSVDLAAAVEPPVADEAESGNGLGRLFLAGAVLLPLAGGATYLTTRKIR